jgi:hypothetical protein
LILAVALVGGWLVVAKPFSNKSGTEVAVEQPAEEKKDEKKADNKANSDDKTSSDKVKEGSGDGFGGSTGSGGSMPSELTTTGPTENTVFAALLVGGVAYLLFLNRSLLLAKSRMLEK